MTTATEELTPRQMAVRAMESLISRAESATHDDENEEDWESPNPDDVLSLDVRTTVTVLLTMNGPTIGIDYTFTDGDFVKAVYWTTDNPRSETVYVDLNDDEAETLADAYCYGIDMLAERAKGEQS